MELGSTSPDIRDTEGTSISLSPSRERRLVGWASKGYVAQGVSIQINHSDVLREFDRVTREVTIATRLSGRCPPGL